MRVYKRCLSVIVACLVLVAMAIPASAVGTTGQTETIQLGNGKSITITNCTSAPYGGPTSTYHYGARTVNLPFSIQLNGSNLKFTDIAGYPKGSFKVREEGNKRYLDVVYGLVGTDCALDVDIKGKSSVTVGIPAMYLVRMLDGNQEIYMWIQASYAPYPKAYPTSSTVKVDGKAVAFDAYNINDNNYFKLRDIAKVLDGTDKQFNVLWDGAKNSIMLTSGESYDAVGGELATGSQTVKDAIPTTSSVYVDNKLENFTAYNIKDNNYFKLRDIGDKLDFGVTWDGATNTVNIDTTTGYEVSNPSEDLSNAPSKSTPAPTPAPSSGSSAADEAIGGSLADMANWSSGNECTGTLEDYHKDFEPVN